MANSIEQSTADMLHLLLPGAPRMLLNALTNHCMFVHGGLLIFSDLQDAQNLLSEMEFSEKHVSQSIIVKKRLVRRYGLDEQQTHIAIIHASRPNASNAFLQLFVLPRGADLPVTLIEQERAVERETHFAFEPIHPDPVVLQGMIMAFKCQGKFCDDGGFFDKGAKKALYLSKTEKREDGRDRLMRIEILHANECFLLSSDL